MIEIYFDTGYFWRAPAQVLALTLSELEVWHAQAIRIGRERREASR